MSMGSRRNEPWTFYCGTQDMITSSNEAFLPQSDKCFCRQYGGGNHEKEQQASFNTLDER